MNFLKKMALVASFALAGAGAHANGTFVPMDSGDPSVFENSWTYNTGTGNDTTPGLGETGPAKTTFADYFLFNVPDDEWVSFSLFGGTVTFNDPVNHNYGFILFSTGLDGFVVDSKEGSTDHSIEGGKYLLTSGTYELDVFGAFTKANGTYDVNIFGTPAIPEPTNVALMLAGLGAMGLMARRRKQQA